eukprot:243112-Amphidinium_carterae.1
MRASNNKPTQPPVAYLGETYVLAISEQKTVKIHCFQTTANSNCTSDMVKMRKRSPLANKA